MAVVNQICASWSDLVRQQQAFESTLQGIEAGINSQVNALVNSTASATLSKQADSALAQANSFFAQQPIGSLDAALTDSGIATPTQTALHALKSLGFYKANNRYWRVNATVNNVTASTVSYGFVGIGDGDATADQISVLLNRQYTEPSEAVIQSMLKTATSVSSSNQNNSSSSSTSNVSDAGSVTGSRTAPGNIASIRELFRGCGSDIATLKSVLAQAYQQGFGCIWSVSMVIQFAKPTALLQDQFNAGYIRKQLNQVIFDSDMDFTVNSRYCYVRQETYLGSNITRQQAQAQANALEQQYQLPVNSLALITRTVEFQTNEDTARSSPLIVSRGCNPHLLSSSFFELGMSVNGIYRVIDCSGDKGLGIVHNNYSTQDIVDSIIEVFGDLVNCGSIGTEFFISLKPGFGALGSISLFYVGGTDCSEAIGLQAAIAESVQARSNIQETRTTVPSLRVNGEVFWYGGSAQPSAFPSSYFITYLNQGNLLPEQRQSLLNTSNYWNSVSSAVSTLNQQLTTACQSGQGVDLVVRQLEQYLGFCDVSGFSYREFLTILSGLGNIGLANLLVNDLDIISLDVYSSTTSVRDSLTSTLVTLTGNSATVPSTTSWMTVSLPLDLNYSTAARLRLLFQESTEFVYVSSTESIKAHNALCNYSGSIASATNSVVSKTSSSSTFTKILDGAEELLQAATDLVDGDMNRAVWNIIKDIPGVSSLLGGEAYLAGKLNALENGADAGVREIQNLVQDLLSSIGLDNLNRKAINVLLEAQACLASAQRVVNSFKSTYNATTKKIVALSNFNLNFSGSQGFQSKYLNCYVSGTANLNALGFLVQMLQTLNNILCLLDSAVASLTGTMTYETTMQVGLVTMKANCTTYVALGSSFNPQILAHIMALRRQLDFLLASLQLQQVTWKSHQTNLASAGSVFNETLEDTLNALLSKLTKCF
jgi:hypothetical protein